MTKNPSEDIVMVAYFVSFINAELKAQKIKNNRFL